MKEEWWGFQVIERMKFRSRSVQIGDCLIWIAGQNNKGYGTFFYDGKKRLAHRVAWELTYGPIPEGRILCHVCDTPLCVNTDHLFLGTQADNMRDAAAKGRNAGQKKTHCPQGHSYAEHGQFREKTNDRICLICRRDRAREWWRRNSGSRRAVA